MNVQKTITVPMKWVRAFQRKLYCAAKVKQGRRFGILYDKVVRKDVLLEAWERVSRNNGSAGVDGETIEWIKGEYGVERFLEEIEMELREERYGADAIRRVYIPKLDGKKRPLGIPTVKDRVVQMAVKLMIEPLFEADFLECSYGFRPKRSNQQAVKEMHQHVNYRKWVVDVDLKSCFDTIPHSKLLEAVRQRVSDPKILHLIRLWLKAGIMEEGQLKYATSGTPQGGVLSPLLSNIYLHELDKRLRGEKGKLIRFADDIVVLCHNQKQAEECLERIKVVLRELGLEINQEKTKICHVGQGVDFLGFTFREGYSERLKRLVRVKYPRAKSMKAIRLRMKETIKCLPLGTQLDEVIRKVNPMLRGWANYFRIGNSVVAALSLGNYACDQLRLFWRRRKHCKHIRGTQWPNSYFYHQGLLYVANLLKGVPNVAS